MRSFFEKAQVEIEKFSVNDIITTSGDPGTKPDDNTGIRPTSLDDNASIYG